MSDSYTVATVLPAIPKDLIGKGDQALLQGCGAVLQTDGDCWYVYAPDGFAEEPDEEWMEEFFIGAPDHLAEIAVLREMLEQDYPVEGNRPLWVSTLLTPTEDNIEADGVVALLVHHGIQVYDILRGLLSKPENAGEARLDSLEIKGSYWSDRERPDHFGGYCAYLTRDNALFSNTDQALRHMADGEGHHHLMSRIEVLEEAARYVINSWESGDLAGAVRELQAAL